MLHFKQLNLHKASQATLLAGQEMEGTTEKILLATEPHTVANRVTGMPKGTVSLYDRTKNGSGLAPRACIVASRSLGLTAMEALCSRDCAVALAKVHGRQTMIASVYMDIKKPVVSKELENIIATADKKQYPLIICLLYTSDAADE